MYDETETEAPKKKKKKVAAAAPAPAAKKKKKKKKGEATKAKAKKTYSRVVEDLKPATLKLISKADAIEERIAQAQIDLQETLGAILESVGTSSFAHPSRGPMSIMVRGEKTYWRTKPSGAV